MIKLPRFPSISENPEKKQIPESFGTSHVEGIGTFCRENFSNVSNTLQTLAMNEVWIGPNVYNEHVGLPITGDQQGQCGLKIRGCFEVIIFIPNNKSHVGLYSCPTQIFKCASNLLEDILNYSISLGIYPSKLYPFLKQKTRLTRITIAQYLYCLTLIEFLKK